MDVKGRIAVVTGAAGGIGSALVRELLVRGAEAVIATDIVKDGVEALAVELNGDAARADGGGRVFPRALDVASEAATAALVNEIEDTLGPIDLFFANAGVGGGQAGPDSPDAEWTRQWNINLMAHVYASRALLPRWIERGEGYLITTASLAGYLTSLGDGVYAAVKHAAVGFAEWMAITYGDQGVKVSCVCPGAVDTAMLRAMTGDADTAAQVIGGGDVLTPAAAAVRVLDDVRDEKFLIYTHPDLKQYVVRKAEDTDRWIRGMTRLWGRSKQLLEG